MSPPLSRVPKRSLQALLCLLVVAASGALRGPAAAQDAKDSKVSVFLSTSKDAKERPKDALELRPNVPQEVFVYVQNDSDKDEVVSVKLFAGGKEEAASAKVTAAKNSVTLVPWPPAPPAAGAAPAPQELGGPVTLRAANEKNEPLGEAVPVFVARPSAFLRTKADYQPEAKRLEVVVKRNPEVPFSGPSSQVSLDLRPDRLRGLVPGQKKQGRYTGRVSAGSSELVLRADNLRFQGDAKGFVYLSVDGYERAFVYLAQFPESGAESTPLEVTAPVLRTSLPGYAQPSPGLPVVVEADGPISAASRIKLEVLASTKDGKDEYAEVAEFKSPRQEKLLYAKGGPRGGLVFQPEVKDLTASLDLSGDFGKTKVRLRLVDRDGKPLPVINGVTAERGLEVVQEIVLDGTAPEEVEFLDAPPAAYRGRALRVKARARDDESGIVEARFYLGKPGPDGKAPPEPPASAGSPVKGEANAWAGEFRLPADQKGPLHVTFVASNGVGLASKPVTLTLDVTDPPPTAAAVSGRVFEKDLPVDFLPVRLLNAKGVPVAEVRSGDGGKFTFKDLEKGRYKIAAARPTTLTKGELAVTIKGVEEVKDLELILLPLTDKEKEAEAKKKGAKIEGLVREGDRAQAGLTVVLSDSNGKQLNTAKTDSAGKYLFEGLPPGTYRVSASKSASNTRGEQRVEVKADERKTAPDIKLFR